MWACLYGYNNKHFTTAGVSPCVWNYIWCWWSGPLPQSFLPCITVLLSLDQRAWKEVGTFGICAVLCKISNTGHLCYWYNASIYSFSSKCLSQLSKKAKYLHVRGARERPSCSYDYRSGSTGICSEVVHKYLTAWFGFLHFTISKIIFIYIN